MGRRCACPTILFPERRKILLRLEGGGAAGAGRGNGLFVNAVGDVAGDEDAGMLALGKMSRDEIAVRIGFQFSLESFRVWVVPDRDEDARDR